MEGSAKFMKHFKGGGAQGIKVWEPLAYTKNHHHHHHQWHHSPINEPWPLLGLFLRKCSTNLFLQGEVVSLTPNPQPGGPGLRIYTPPPGDRVAQLYPWTLGSSYTSGSPFSVPIYMGP
jgi:hypothetical protein